MGNQWGRLTDVQKALGRSKFKTELVKLCVASIRRLYSVDFLNDGLEDKILQRADYPFPPSSSALSPFLFQPQPSHLGPGI